LSGFIFTFGGFIKIYFSNKMKHFILKCVVSSLINLMITIFTVGVLSAVMLRTEPASRLPGPGSVPVPGLRVSILTQHLSPAAAVPAAPLSRAVSGAPRIPPAHTAGCKGQRRFAPARHAVAAGSRFPQRLCSPV